MKDIIFYHCQYSSFLTIVVNELFLRYNIEEVWKTICFVSSNYKKQLPLYDSYLKFCQALMDIISTFLHFIEIYR